MLELKNVTLIAMASMNVEATVKALEYSCRGIEFAEVKLVSHYKPANFIDGMLFQQTTQTRDIDEWSYKAIYELPNYVNTEYAMLVHADGFVVNPESWRDEFFEYDYIGAPWALPNDNFSFRDIKGDIIRAGNSVSLRSKKLMDLANDLNLEWRSWHGYYNEDGFICVNNRHIYEAHGLKIAPLEVAKYFSHEAMIPEVQGIKPFAFHKWNGTNSIYPRF